MMGNNSPKTQDEIFSQRLRELRASKEKTQAEFVVGLGITASALSSYEKNTKNPSINVVKRIAKKYNVSIDWLCGLSEKQENSERIENYADLIRYIARISSIGALDIYLADRVGQDILFTTQNKYVINFFSDMRKMCKLCKDGTISEHVYSIWLNDKLKEYESITLDESIEIPKVKDISKSFELEPGHVLSREDEEE